MNVLDAAALHVCSVWVHVCSLVCGCICVWLVCGGMCVVCGLVCGCMSVVSVWGHVLCVV